MRKIMIDIMREIILKEEIDNTFWPEIVQAITHIKNLQLYH